jgi:hypothetical protein
LVLRGFFEGHQTVLKFFVWNRYAAAVLGKIGHVFTQLLAVIGTASGGGYQEAESDEHETSWGTGPMYREE